MYSGICSFNCISQNARWECWVLKCILFRMCREIISNKLTAAVERHNFCLLVFFHSLFTDSQCITPVYPLLLAQISPRSEAGNNITQLFAQRLIFPNDPFSKFLCLMLTCGDWSDWSHFNLIMPDKAAVCERSATLCFVKCYWRNRCFYHSKSGT